LAKTKGQYACRDWLETGRWSQNSIEGRAAMGRTMRSIPVLFKLEFLLMILKWC